MTMTPGVPGPFSPTPGVSGPGSGRAPAFAQSDGRVKTSAAWLIDHAGYGKGFKVAEDAPASLSTKHVLALTNRGGASSGDFTTLARTVIDGVRDVYGITLVPEPRLIGCTI